ncbi:MAG: methylated-DNA--[Eggerthellaceae bacterium]|nr:methylated-DNA--[protein]-cysteine S-methyltransferase [Eggerthellaceae bacterium]
MRTVFYSYRTPLGPLTLAANETGITHAAFGESIESLPPHAERRASALTNRAANEMLEYLAGKRRVFDVPLNPQGTEFQRKVWRELTRIPYGSTRTSTQVAERLGMEEGHRSVGAAIRKNPLAVLVPDHRIVASNGTVPGVGESARHRSLLLAFEQAQLKNDK